MITTECTRLPLSKNFMHRNENQLISVLKFWSVEETIDNFENTHGSH